ncbi:TM2 domain-containing protein [Burkholderia sp. BCC0405]|uniref:TM2 domain-containing protein n=1 Tax=Burkholderia sp. BCC0405 TaxID=2676298 RepID=UPI00158E6077|nr:TM2 domain-containing protein [Burkholderia sp. BCC0405]
MENNRFIVVLLLCIFLGTLGVHRFYVGKIATGLLQLVTLGGLGLWTIVDFLMIVMGKFKDKGGNRIAWDSDARSVS